MPLVQGYSRAAISTNIRREMRRGVPQRQAVAIALETARRARARRQRRRNPDRGDWIDLLVPVAFLVLLIRGRAIQVGS